MRDFAKGLGNGRISVRECKSEIISVRECKCKRIIKVTY